MLLERILVDSDLSSAAISCAQEQLKTDKIRCLVAGSADINNAVALAREFAIPEVLLDTNILRGGWYVVAEWRGIYSPGV